MKSFSSKYAGRSMSDMENRRAFRRKAMPILRLRKWRSSNLKPEGKGEKTL
tara:strand:- start:175 stop:327 length:153 start_codon:yes stop_codon:yes gene_type:complete